MRLTSLPRGGQTPSVRIWGATDAGRMLAHPNTGRAPGDRPDGVSMPDDAFTARRVADGDWTTASPSSSPSPPPDETPPIGGVSAAPPARTKPQAE